jgi:hypothetical protein
MLNLCSRVPKDAFSKISIAIPTLHGWIIGFKDYSVRQKAILAISNLISIFRKDDTILQTICTPELLIDLFHTGFKELDKRYAREVKR